MTKLLTKNDEYHFIVSPMVDQVYLEKIKSAIQENSIILENESFRTIIIDQMDKQGQMCHTTIPHPDIYETFHDSTFKYNNMICAVNKGYVRACAIFNIVKTYIYINVICNDPRYGKGYGKKLIDKIVDICRSLGLSSIQLYADPGEDEDKEDSEEKGHLLPYYRSLGFHSITSDGDPNSLILEIKPISPKRSETPRMRHRTTKMRSRASRMTVSKKYKNNTRSNRKTMNSL